MIRTVVDQVYNWLDRRCRAKKYMHEVMLQPLVSK